jgi:hypothetical protein
MLKAIAIFSLGIISCFAFFISGAWLSDSRKGSVVWIAIAAICIIAAIALSGCGTTKALIGACLENKC